MIRILFCCALVTLVVGPDSIPLDQKLKMIFDEMDKTNDGLVNQKDVQEYFQQFKKHPGDTLIECRQFEHQWHQKYRDDPHVSYNICTQYFDSNGDGFLDENDLDSLFNTVDTNDNMEVDYAEFDVYFRKMYNELGVHSRY